MDAFAAEVVLWGTAVTIAGAIIWRVIRAAGRFGGLPDRMTRLEARMTELEREQERHVKQYHRPRTRNQE